MKKTIAVIGEGITEKYYIESIKRLSDFKVMPSELGKRASSLKKLKDDIDGAIKAGFDEVYCLIDMDGKHEGTCKSQYDALKRKYHGITHGNKKKGIQCKVIFTETERCTELWFLYHFTPSATTKQFQSYKELEKELHKYRPQYDKSKDYFQSVGSLHNELTKKADAQGSLAQAIKNSKSSLASKERDERQHTYSEFHVLFEALRIPI